MKPTQYIVSVNGSLHYFKSRPAARVYKALQKARGASVWMRAIF